MNNLFLSLIFVALDFNINIGNFTIGLIPDFVGYIFMIKAFDELSARSVRFTNARPIALAAAIYCGILYALDLFGITGFPVYLEILAGMISVAVMLYLLYVVVLAVRDIEAEAKVNLRAMTLRNTWMLLTVFNVFSYFLSLIPLISLFAVIASFVCGILFIVRFNNTKNLYIKAGL